MSEGGFQLAGVRRIGIEGVLMADRFRVPALADFGVEPAACVQSLSFAGKGESPFSEAGFENVLIERGEVANAADAERVEILLHDLADAGHLPDFEWRQKARFNAREKTEDAVGFGLVR